MRIVAGRFGGRRLLLPKGRDIRPTSDKMRGAIFNALRSRGAVDGVIVLDVFCGTGALGLEALSQGAAHCSFIDRARDSLNLARSNAEMLGAESVDFILADAVKLKAATRRYDLVFLDPPYKQDLVLPALEVLAGGGWLAPNCMIVIEAERSFALPPGALEIISEKIYGDSKLILGQPA